MAVSTVVNDISEFADGLFGLAIDASTMSAVKTMVNNNGLYATMNSLYSSLLGTQSTSVIAQTIVHNLGLSSSADAALVTQIIRISLDAAALSNTQGETVMNLLNAFAGLTNDAALGTAATSWVNEIANADAYSQNSTYSTFVFISDIPVNTGSAGTTLDISGYTGIHNLSQTTPAVTTLNINSSSATASLLNLASNLIVNDNNNISYDSSTLTLTHAGSGQNSLTVNFNGIEGLSLTSTGDSSLTINTPAGTGNHIAIALAETDNQLTVLKFTGGDNIYLVNSYVNNINDSAITDVGASIPLGTTVASSLTRIDASGTTGGVTIYAGATENGVSYAGLEIYGGGGGDSIDNYANNGSIIEGATAASTATYKTNTLSVSGNNSSINDSASTLNDTISLSGFNDSATLGSGNDHLTMYSGESVVLGSGQTTVTVNNHTYPYGTTPVTGIDTITVGSGQADITDTLQLQGNANGNILEIDGNLNNAVLNIGYGNNFPSLGAASPVSGTQTLDQAINQFLGKTAWFQYGGNTYIVDGGNTYASSYVAKLAGTVDLSHATVSGGHIYL